MASPPRSSRRTHARAGRLLTDWSSHERKARGKKRQLRRVRSEQINADSRGWLARRNPERHSAIVAGLSKRQELFAWFNLLDDDDSGEISIAELEDPLIALGFASSQEQVAALIATVDDDGSGEIGFEEFLRMLEAGGENVRLGCIPLTRGGGGKKREALASGPAL